MRFAYWNGKPISVDEYEDHMHITDEKGNPLILKRGSIRQPHFSRIGTSDVNGDNKGPWHQAWQDAVAKECCEFFMGEHIADIFISTSRLYSCTSSIGRVIEIQHSRMDASVVRKREDFYTNQGLELFWIFDGSDWRYERLGNNQIKKVSGKNCSLNVNIKHPHIKLFIDLGRKEIAEVMKISGKVITIRPIPIADFCEYAFGTALVQPIQRPFHHHI